MKKIILLTLIFILSCSSFVFADSNSESNFNTTSYTDQKLIELAEKGILIKNEKIEIKKVKDPSSIISNCKNISPKDLKIYLIKEKKNKKDKPEMNLSVADANLLENSTIEEYELRAVIMGAGEIREQETSARIYSTAVLGYYTVSNDGGNWVGGRYFGGKIDSQPASSQITSLTAWFKEYGLTAIDITGNYYQNHHYEKNATFNLSKHNTLQTSSVNTGKYVDSMGVGSIVGMHYYVEAIVNGYNTSFTVVVAAVGNPVDL